MTPPDERSSAGRSQMLALIALTIVVTLGAGLLVYPWVLNPGYAGPFREIEAVVQAGSLVGQSRQGLVDRFGPPADLPSNSYSTAAGPVTIQPNQSAWRAGKTYDASWPVFLIITFDEHSIATRAALSQPDPKLYATPKGPHG